MFINFHSGVPTERIESFPTDDESVANLASIKPVFIPEKSKEEEERLSLDQLKLWPIGSEEENDGDDDNIQPKDTRPDIKTDPDVEKEFAATATRRKVLASLQDTGFQLDQLVTITKMLRKKEYMTLEACGRSLKLEDEDEKLLVFVNSIRQNAKTASEAAEKRLSDAEDVIKRRRKFIKDCKELQDKGWKIKRLKFNQLGIECSPGWKHEMVSNSLYSIKVLKAGYVHNVSFTK